MTEFASKLTKAVVILLGFLFIFWFILEQCEKNPPTVFKTRKKAQNFYTKGIEYLKKNPDSALVFLNQSNVLYGNQINPAKKMIKKINDAKDFSVVLGKYQATWGDNPKKEFQDLLNDEQTAIIFQNAHINKVALKTLKENKEKVFKSIPEYFKELKRKKLEKEASKLKIRMQTAETLRETFLDAGYDIEVNIWGKHKSNITFEYPLMGDVWIHHFKKKGGLRNLIMLGFEEVHFKDGYDFHKLYDLKGEN